MKKGNSPLFIGRLFQAEEGPGERCEIGRGQRRQEEESRENGRRRQATGVELVRKFLMEQRFFFDGKRRFTEPGIFSRNVSVLTNFC